MYMHLVPLAEAVTSPLAWMLAPLYSAGWGEEPDDSLLGDGHRHYIPRWSHELGECAEDYTSPNAQALCDLCVSLAEVPLSMPPRASDCDAVNRVAPALLEAVIDRYSEVLRQPPPPSGERASLHALCGALLNPLMLRTLISCNQHPAALGLISRISADDAQLVFTVPDDVALAAPIAPSYLSLAEGATAHTLKDQVESAGDPYIALAIRDSLLSSGDRACSLITSRLSFSRTCAENEASFRRVLLAHRAQLTNILRALALISPDDHLALQATCRQYLDWMLAYQPGCDQKATLDTFRQLIDGPHPPR